MTRIIIYIYEFKKAVVVVLFTVTERINNYYLEERNHGLIAII